MCGSSVMKTPIPTDSSKYTSSGTDCIYFDNGDGTGWKLYRNKEDAVQAWASQIWALRKNAAPFILSGVKELAMSGRTNYGFLVEHVDMIGIDFNEKYSCVLKQQRSYFKELFSTKDSLDCHTSNWGIIRDTLVMIDFGFHFLGGLNTKQRAEIEKIQTQVTISILGD